MGWAINIVPVIKEAKMIEIRFEDLQQIVDLANSVPQEYRQKTFELLLASELQKQGNNHFELPVPQQVAPSWVENASLPIDVKALFNQYHLDLDLLPRLFHMEGGDVRPIYKLNENTKVKAELNHALLMALENAIRTGQFQVEVEAVRNRCQEQKCYDMANFMRHLRKNSRLFKTISNDQPLILSTEGKAQLSALLRRLEMAQM
jgi:hypothetical protein